MSLTRLFRFLAIVAILFAPLSMASGHAAMAMPAPSATMSGHMATAAPMGHCADMDGEQDKSGPSAPSIDCLIACSALPTMAFEVESHPAVHGLIQPAALVGALTGRHPESDPPPPRLV